MAEKDMAEKTLEAYNDVFADIETVENWFSDDLVMA